MRPHFRFPFSVPLLLLCCLPAAFPEPWRPDAYRAHAKRLELCRSVLRRDDRWRAVLDQRVKLSAVDRPPYQDDERVANGGTSLRLVAAADGAAADTVTPRTVMQTAVGEFWWLGSHVAYAVRVLREAFACVALVHVTRVLELMEALHAERGETEPKKRQDDDDDDDDDDHKGDGETAERRGVTGDGGRVNDRTAGDVAPFAASFREAWTTVALLANKLLAVGGRRLDAWSDVSMVFSEAVVNGETVPGPVLKLTRRRIDETIDGRCDRQSSARAHADLGAGERPAELAATSGPPETTTTVGRLSRELIAFYGSLEVDAVPLDTWSEVFNYQLPVLNNVVLRTRLDTAMERDPKVRALKRKFKKELYDEYYSSKSQADAAAASAARDDDDDEDDDDILRFDL